MMFGQNLAEQTKEIAKVDTASKDLDRVAAALDCLETGFCELCAWNE